MGFLTTITFSNDAADQYKKNPERLAEIIDDATIGYKCDRNGGRAYSEPIGNHCNPLTVQKTRHADDHTIYVHMGNTVCEMTPYSADTNHILKHNKEYFDSMLSYMEGQVKALKHMKKEHLAKTHNNSPEGLDELRVKLMGMSSQMPDAKIAKIKLIREWTGYSLKEAVEFMTDI